MSNITKITNLVGWLHCAFMFNMFQPCLGWWSKMTSMFQGGESTDFSTDFRGISVEKNIVPGVSIFCFTLSCSQYNWTKTGKNWNYFTSSDPPWHLISTFYLASILAFYLASILTFYLTYVLAFCLAFYLASILTFYLSHVLTVCLAFYLASILTFYLSHVLTVCLAFYLASILTFYLSHVLTVCLAFYLASILTFYLSHVLTVCQNELHCRWQHWTTSHWTCFQPWAGILSGIYSDILSDICSAAFSFACVRAQAWTTAPGDGDMVFRSRRGPLHPKIATWLGGEGGRGRRRRTRGERRGRRRSCTFVKI